MAGGGPDIPTPFQIPAGGRFLEQQLPVAPGPAVERSASGSRRRVASLEVARATLPCVIRTDRLQGTRLKGCLLAWKSKEDGGAFAQFALSANLAAVALDDVLHDRQAQAGSSLVARPRPVHPVKTLKDAVQ